MNFLELGREGSEWRLAVVKVSRAECSIGGDCFCAVGHFVRSNGETFRLQMKCVTVSASEDGTSTLERTSRWAEVGDRKLLAEFEKLVHLANSGRLMACPCSWRRRSARAKLVNRLMQSAVDLARRIVTCISRVTGGNGALFALS